jgi:hypothetical protein
MESEGSLPCLQQSTTSPRHKPDESNPHPPPFSLRSILILSTHTRLGLPGDVFSSDFYGNITACNHSLQCLLHDLPISLSLTVLCYLARSTSYTTASAI